MAHRLLQGIVGGLTLTLLAATAAAQSRWAEPYRLGSEAVKAGRYDEGIPQLERAIAIDARQQRVKIVEGVVSVEYFPYYYLGVAYLRTNQLDKAEQAFRDARTCKCLTTALTQLMGVHEADLAARRAAATKPVEPKPDPKPPATNPDFIRQLNEADAAMSQGRFVDAIRLFDALRSMDNAEYTKRGLSGRRTEAERARASQLVRQGDQLLASGAIADARSRYRDAENALAGSGQAGLGEILRRQSEYSRLKGEAQTDQRAGRTEAALDKLKQAEGADPEQYRADNMAAQAQAWSRAISGNNAASRARDMIKRAQGQVAARRYRDAASSYRVAISLEPENAEAKAWLEAHTQFEALRDRGRAQHKDRQFEQALQSLDEARRIDQDRFTFEKLDALVKEMTDALGHLPEAQIAPVRAGLVAYLTGDSAGAVKLLEPLAGDAALDVRVRKHVFAYLGAAYGDLALIARRDAERADLKGKALDLFARLIALEPDYQLRDSLISPRVREMLEEARIRR